MDIFEMAIARALAGGGGIIDVTELPTTNIDENAFCCIIIPTFYMDGWAQSTTVHIVNGLPTSGEPFTLDGQTLQTAYYNNNDGALYFYVTEELAAMGLPVGWLTAEQVAQIFDTMFAEGAGVITYGGVVESQDDLVGNPYMYLLLKRHLYFYKGGKWREVATEGASLSIKTKIFTSWNDAIGFCGKHDVYKIRVGGLRFVTKLTTATNSYVTTYVSSTNGFIRAGFGVEKHYGTDYEIAIEANYSEDGSCTPVLDGGISHYNNEVVTEIDGSQVKIVVVQYFA